MSEDSCPNCGEPVERRQLVCLNCGARVALRERTGWAREPVTAVAAALVVLIVIGAGLFGFAISELTSGDDGGDGAPQRAAAEGARRSCRAASSPRAPRRRRRPRRRHLP